jgi:hypothetical protein
MILDTSTSKIDRICFRIESDQFWTWVDSPEFRSKFLEHDMPGICKLAKTHRTMCRLRHELVELRGRLRDAVAEKEDDERRPGELIRMFKVMMQPRTVLQQNYKGPRTVLHRDDGQAASQL